MFDTLAKLCDVLELKCDIGIKLKDAYDKKDKVALKELSETVMPEILDRIEEYYEAFKKQWYKESKTGGFDIQDIRFGGLIRRIQTAIQTVTEYIGGGADYIEELEQARLPFDCRTSNEGLDINSECNFWNYIVTPNVNGRF